VTTSSERNGPISPTAHRILWILTWILFALGMLEWFVQGANRPVDPIVSQGVITLVPLVVYRTFR
jgi:hypothetical protein